MSDYHFWNICKRIALATLCAVVLFTAFPILSPPLAQGAEVERPQELIFEVTLPPYRVSPGVFAYQYNERFYLPLLELAESYEFFTEADLGRGYVRGWWGEPLNSYSIDTERGELIIKGERFPLSPDDVLENDNLATDDFYVSTDTLSRIWPISFDVQLSTLTVVTEIVGDVTLPFEQRMKRQKRQEAMAYREEKRRKEKDLPFVPNSYKMFSYPVLDFQGTYDYRHNDRELTGSNTVTGLMHMAGFATDFSGTWRLDNEGRIERPNNIRIHMQREALGDDDIWGTGLRNIRAGDINMQQRDLVSRSYNGRGLFVSNRKQRETSNEFDRITVEGIGPPGWEIEVYLNNTLIEFGEVEADGEYRFEDVALQYGNNNVRVVLYGPQGQIREDVENYNISGQQRKPGEFQYDVGFLDSDRPLVFLDNEPRTQPRGIAKTANMSYGLSRNMTVFGSMTDIPTEQGEKRYATAGANFSLLNSSIQAEGYKEISGGNALDLRMLTQLLGMRLNLRSSFYNDFESPETGTGNNANRFESEVRMSTRIPFFYFGKMGLRVNADHRETVAGNVFTNINTSQTLSKKGLLMTHSTRTSLTNEVHANSSGNLNVNYNIRDWQLRGSLSYLIHPKKELNSFQSTLRYSDNEDPFQFAVNAQHNFLTTLSGAGVQFGYEFDKILGSIDVDYREQEGWNITARASSSLTPYNADGKYKFTSRQQRKQKPILGRVFLDNDTDGTFSEGDEPLKNARLLANGRKSKEASNEDGYVMITGGGTGITNVEIEEGSLMDPYFRSMKKGYSTTPLPGTMPSFDFPVLETGIAEGFVTYLSDGRPVQGMIIQLVDQNGDVAMESETAFDGYYAFEFVLPGTYTIRAHPQYKVNVPPETVTVTSEDLFLYGVDLFLVEQTDEVGAAVNQIEAAGGEDRGNVAQANHDNGTQSAPTSSSNTDFSNVVEYVRIGEYPGKTRLVLDLSGPVTYNIKTSDDGKTVLVNMPDVGWDPAKIADISNISLINGLDIAAMQNATGGTQLRIATSKAVTAGPHGILPPSQKWNTGHRLYLDIIAPSP